METIETKLIICESEKRFLELLGNGSEFVKVTFSGGRVGWWLYENSDGKNTFTKQYLHQKEYPKLVERFFCETKYLQFDRNLGICPNSFNHDYSPLGEKNSEERDAQIEKLKARGLWKE